MIGGAAGNDLVEEMGYAGYVLSDGSVAATDSLGNGLVQDNLTGITNVA